MSRESEPELGLWRTVGAAGRRRLSLDPMVSRLNKLDSLSPVLPIRVDIPWHRGVLELIERRNDPHARAIVGDEILKQKEVHVPAKVLEQPEEVAVPSASVSPEVEGGIDQHMVSVASGAK